MPELVPIRDEVVREAATLTEPDEWKWRPLGAPLDLLEIKRDQAFAASKKLFQASPLAWRMIRRIVDFVVGAGLHLSSPQPEANEILNKFWTSPINDLPENISLHVQELLTFGELCYAVKVRRQDGQVLVTFIPAEQIESVQQREGYPGEVEAIKLRSNQEFQVIRWRRGRLRGNCFFKRFNRLGGQLRGYPYFLACIDWLSVYDSYCYNKLEKQAHFDAIWWDVELEGKTEDEIEAWLQERRRAPPRPGSIIAHNEKVTWELKAAARQERADLPRYFQQFILATGGLSPFPGVLPRAVRERGEILDPVTRSLANIQQEIKAFYKFIGEFVIQEAIRFKRLPPGEYTVECGAPRLGVRDIQRSAGAIQRISQALALAEERGWLSKEETGRVYRELLALLGFVKKPPPAPLPQEGT